MKRAPTFHEPACQSASADRPAAIGSAATAPRQPRGRGSTSWRSRSDGGTRWISASGGNAHSSVTPTPIAIPCATAAGAMVQSSGKGSRRERAGERRAEEGAGHAAREPQRRGLQEIRKKDAPPWRTQALERSDGGEAP